MSSEVELLFLGTGTSAGIPMIGCHCEVCSSADSRDKRTRPSVLISAGGARVLVDTTPELRLQCVANRVDMVEAVVFTHAHADHMMGLDDLRRFNAMSGASLDVWSDAATTASLDRCFGYAFQGPTTELKVFRPNLIHRLIEGSFQIGAATWKPVPLIHGRGRVLGFRVGSLAYCTDVSTMPEESYPLLQNLDVLVLGALSPHKHPSHFSLDEAIEVARRSGAKQTFFTHIGHTIAHQKIEPTLPHCVHLAYDGLRVTARSAPN